ncbi:hypothetical protein [Kitasatospora sp. NPDC058046]|uniref:hypothetical protein n=1 Tax=Kitasatospora sp. NPDC058046 TaxID=3346312 RepID=UPI0036D9DF71
MIITRNRPRQQHLSADAFDRAPTRSSLAALLMVLHAALLHAANGLIELLDKRREMAQ